MKGAFPAIEDYTLLLSQSMRIWKVTPLKIPARTAPANRTLFPIRFRHHFPNKFATSSTLSLLPHLFALFKHQQNRLGCKSGWPLFFFSLSLSPLLIANSMDASVNFVQHGKAFVLKCELREAPDHVRICYERKQSPSGGPLSPGWPSVSDVIPKTGLLGG